MEVLKKLKGIEVKRLKILRGQDSGWINAQRKKIRKLSKMTESEKNTRIGLYNYAHQAVDSLKEVREMLDRKSITGTPSFATLRLARSYIQSYAGFIKDMRKSMFNARKD